MTKRCGIIFLSTLALLFICSAAHASDDHKLSDTTDLGYGINSLATGLVMKYSHRTAKGKVYMLPYDNMPCLMPDSSYYSRMPVRTLPGYRNRMPNLTPQYRLKPKQ